MKIFSGYDISFQSFDGCSQRTQYYPSGLPWESNAGDNPYVQPNKYGGKEFVEMHGLDEYDSQARWYYPAIMRTTIQDPLAEKYYNISPYVWAGNNPVNNVDLDGKDWYSYNEEYEDENGEQQTRTSYKYVEGQMSAKEMKAGGYTYLGKTHTDGNRYFSLFGSEQDLTTSEGQIYQKIDQAIIDYANYLSEIKEPQSPFDSEVPIKPYTDFTIKGLNKNRITYYEGTFNGRYYTYPENTANNRASIKDCIGYPDQPKDIGGWKSETKAYHILFTNKNGIDVVHLKYDEKTAKRLLNSFHNLFPALK